MAVVPSWQKPTFSVPTQVLRIELRFEPPNLRKTSLLFFVWTVKLIDFLNLHSCEDLHGVAFFIYRHAALKLWPHWHAWTRQPMETSNIALIEPCACPPSVFNYCVSTPYIPSTLVLLSALPQLEVHLCGLMRITCHCRFSEPRCNYVVPASSVWVTSNQMSKVCYTLFYFQTHFKLKYYHISLVQVWPLDLDNQ